MIALTLCFTQVALAIAAEEFALLHTPHGYCAGPPAVVRGAWVSVDRKIERLESFAHLLYDPKRVRAAAAGIQLEAPRVD